MKLSLGLLESTAHYKFRRFKKWIGMYNSSDLFKYLKFRTKLRFSTFIEQMKSNLTTPQT